MMKRKVRLHIPKYPHGGPHEELTQAKYGGIFQYNEGGAVHNKSPHPHKKNSVNHVSFDREAIERKLDNNIAKGTIPMYVDQQGESRVHPRQGVYTQGRKKGSDLSGVYKQPVDYTQIWEDQEDGVKDLFLPPVTVNASAKKWIPKGGLSRTESAGITELINGYQNDEGIHDAIDEKKFSSNGELTREQAYKLIKKDPSLYKKAINKQRSGTPQVKGITKEQSEKNRPTGINTSIYMLDDAYNGIIDPMVQAGKSLFTDPGQLGYIPDAMKAYGQTWMPETFGEPNYVDPEYWANAQKGMVAAENVLTVLPADIGKSLLLKKVIKTGLTKPLARSLLKAEAKVANTVLKTKKRFFPKYKNTGKNTKTGLTDLDIDDAIKQEKDWLQSDEYLKRRMANTGETAEQVIKDVQKIIKRGDKARFNVNANISSEGFMGERSIQNPLYPVVKINKTAANPKMVLEHETGHLYSPVSTSGPKSYISNLHKNQWVKKDGEWIINPDVGNLPANERGVYANYPTLGDINDGYEALGFEQQVRHKNAMRQIAKHNNVPQGTKLTAKQVDEYVDEWLVKINEGKKHPDMDFNTIWAQEHRKIEESLYKKHGLSNAEDLSELKGSKRDNFFDELESTFKKNIRTVLNKAWAAVPVGVATGAALGGDDADSQRIQNGTPSYKFNDGGYFVEEYHEGGAVHNKSPHPHPKKQVVDKYGIPIKGPVRRSAGDFIPKEEVFEWESAPKERVVKSAPSKAQKLFDEEFAVTGPGTLESLEIKAAEETDKTIKHLEKKGVPIDENTREDLYQETLDNSIRYLGNENTFGQVSKKKEQSSWDAGVERVEDIITNLPAAAKYSFVGGGLDNMPRNYNQMLYAERDAPTYAFTRNNDGTISRSPEARASINPGAASFQERFGYGDEGMGEGSNTLDLVNEMGNPLKWASLLDNALSKGNYGDAAIEAAALLPFIPANLIKKGKNIAKNIKSKVYKPIKYSKVNELGKDLVKGKKYPIGKITKQEKEMLNIKLNEKPFNTKAFKHLHQDPDYLSTSHRNHVNNVLYGGHDLSTGEKIMNTVGYSAAVGATGMIGYMATDMFLEDPYKNAINRKLNRRLFNTQINSDPSTTFRDTTINLNNNYVDFARVNETADGETILGGDFISNNNNTVRTAKEWLTTKDKTYGDRSFHEGRMWSKSKIKDIKSFYGVENGELKVGPASDFNSETVIVPNRYDEGRKISSAKMNGDYLRIVDKNNKPIYQNVQWQGKMILYSDKTKKSQFISFNEPETGVKQINAFIKENPDTMPIILDNGRYRAYMHNKEGLTNLNFQNYYTLDEFHKGNPGYNLVLKNKLQSGKSDQ